MQLLRTQKSGRSSFIDLFPLPPLFSLSLANNNTENPSKVSFPATFNLARASENVQRAGLYISRYSSTNAEIAIPVADAMTTIRGLLSTVETWCSKYDSDGAPSSVKSYCDIDGRIKIRCDAGPTNGFPLLARQDSSLITETISITNILIPTPTTLLDTSDSSSSDQSQPPRSSSLFHSLPRRKSPDLFAAWGVSNDENPPETGTFILSLPPHKWDCVRRPQTCKVLLPLIGVLCGIPLGALLYYVLSKWHAYRLSTRDERKTKLDERTGGPGGHFAAAREKIERKVRGRQGTHFAQALR